jgi:hypothetical protein
MYYKTSTFAGNIILYKEKPKDFTQKTELKTEFNKLTQSKINKIKISTIFIGQ